MLFDAFRSLSVSNSDGVLLSKAGSDPQRLRSKSRTLVTSIWKIVLLLHVCTTAAVC